MSRGRDKISTEVWDNFGEYLLKLGRVIDEGSVKHFHAMDVIESNIKKLKSSIKRGDEVKGKFFTKNLNEVIDEIVDPVWNKWKNSIRGVRRNQRTKTVRIPNGNYEYVEKFARNNEVSPKCIFDGIGDNFYLMNNSQRRALSRLDSLSTADKELCRSIITMIIRKLKSGRKICLAEIVEEARGNDVSKGGYYVFGTINRVKPSEDNTIRFGKIKKVPLSENNKIRFLVSPLPIAILKYFATLRQWKHLF
ncbi:hypothetical protein J3369_16105 [Alteromonas sp. NFXS44]|uniref:hypothetical protein n=1 Tax=Alteromonas sp. NFXS44 TaxID=2818435 RepID=UPI0032DFBB2E